MNKQKAEAVIEAILFTMGDSVEVEKLAEVIEKDAWMDVSQRKEPDRNESKCNPRWSKQSHKGNRSNRGEIERTGRLTTAPSKEGDKNQ